MLRTLQQRTLPGLAAILVALACAPAVRAQFWNSSAGAAAATAVHVEGNVCLLRDSYLWAVNTGDRIQPQQIIRDRT